MWKPNTSGGETAGSSYAGKASNAIFIVFSLRWLHTTISTKNTKISTRNCTQKSTNKVVFIPIDTARMFQFSLTMPQSVVYKLTNDCAENSTQINSFLQF
jgi:hypothetical protein